MTFQARTKHSAKFKALFEALFQNMTTVCLMIDDAGIRSETYTTQNLLVSVTLPATAFDEYRFVGGEPILVGVGSHINQLLKGANAKTTLTFGISRPQILNVEIASAVDNCVESLSATLQCVQNVALTAFPVYSRPPTQIYPPRFNVLCRSIKSNTVRVQKQRGRLLFTFEVAGLCEKTFSFGDDDPNDRSPLVSKEIRSEQLMRVRKLYKMGDGPIEVYVEHNYPIMIVAYSPIGQIRVLINDEDVNCDR